MKILVTGGAGFIGRWVVKLLIEKGHNVKVLDNLSTGDKNNVKEFSNDNLFNGLIVGDITNRKVISEVFKEKYDLCIHLAAQVDVQESLEDPKKSFETDIVGTFNILEELRKTNTKLLMMSTCMVYDVAAHKLIDEKHPVNPTSPYAAAKLSAETMALAYYHAYGLPVVVIRPFNTYGPYQKYDPERWGESEGGVIPKFIFFNLTGKKLTIYGDGEQTRDFLYVGDCADFVVKAAFSDAANGQIFNAGIGKDISVNGLASIIAEDKDKIVYVEHHHPQSDVRKLVCDYSKAKKILNWSPKIDLNTGIKLTENWIKKAEGGIHE